MAGGGAFLALPTLMSIGVTPVRANATSTLAMWPGTVSSALAYRREIAASWRALLPLAAVSLLGGLVGAVILVRTSDSSFMRLLPWLMLLAAVTFTMGGKLTRHGGLTRLADGVPWWAVAAQFAISLYGGYFGGGMGIMMLATMALSGMADIHEMIGLKNTLAVAINAMALLAFIVNRTVSWLPGLVMTSGAIIGGYAGAAGARLVDPRRVRIAVIVIAWSMSIYFFVR